MLQSYYLGLGALAAAATYLWAFRRERIALTTAVAASTWALLALTGGSVAKRTQCCETAVPVADPVRYVLAGLALLSFLAFILFLLGSYPPEETEVPDAGEGASVDGGAFNQ
jgi:hypothetical protein